MIFRLITDWELFQFTDFYFSWDSYLNLWRRRCIRTQTKQNKNREENWKRKICEKMGRDTNRKRHRHSIEQLNGIIISFKICFCTNLFYWVSFFPCVCVRGANCYSFFLCVFSFKMCVCVAHLMFLLSIDCGAIRAAVCFSRFGQAT